MNHPEEKDREYWLRRLHEGPARDADEAGASPGTPQPAFYSAEELIAYLSRRFNRPVEEIRTWINGDLPPRP